MSLRADIHTAFDELAPATTGLPVRVVQSVADVSARRQRRQVWRARLRAPLSLVAVFLLIALVVGAMVGGRLVSDWRTYMNPTHPAGINPLQLHRLELRPLHLPPYKAGDPCPSGPWDSSTGWLGKGPVYGAEASSTLVGWGTYITTSWGTYFLVSFESDPALKGPLLIRGRSLDSGHDLVFIGTGATGPLTGTDLVNGQLVEHRPEMALNASDSPAPRGGYVEWRVTAGAVGYQPFAGPKTSSTSAPVLTCTLWQIDGLSFSETFVTD